MLRRVIVAVLSASSFVGGSAMAQGEGQRIVIERAPPNLRQEGTVRVQTSISLFVPSPTDDGEEAIKNRDRARRMIYEMAGKECDLLREVLARDCRLESISSNLNRQPMQSVSGYSVNGSMVLQITLK